MKTRFIKKYQCEICGTLFDTKEEAIRCESRSVTQGTCSVTQGTLRYDSYEIIKVKKNKSKNDK
jgi:hypothetical protein